jgi:aminoglycoside phosphotransferase (APT) family kinase protein
MDLLSINQGYLIQGDLLLDNIITKNHSIAAIIDASDAASADPMEELGYMNHKYYNKKWL